MADYEIMMIFLEINKADNENIIFCLQSYGGGGYNEKKLNGLDSYITKYFDEEGMELSGRQYQKLALARTDCCLRSGSGRIDVKTL